MVIEYAVELEIFEDDELHSFAGIDESCNREIQGPLEISCKILARIWQDFLTFLTYKILKILQEYAYKIFKRLFRISLA